MKRLLYQVSLIVAFACLLIFTVVFVILWIAGIVHAWQQNWMLGAFLTLVSIFITSVLVLMFTENDEGLL